MRKLTIFQTVLSGALWATRTVALGAIIVGHSIATGQEGKGGGKGGGAEGGGAERHAQGGGKDGGGEVRAQGGRKSGGGEARGQAQGGAGARVRGGQPRIDDGRGAPVQGGAKPPSGGATVRTPAGDANIRTPSADGGARVRGDAGAAVRGARANARGASANARGRTQPGASSAIDNVLNRGQGDAAHTVRRVPSDDPSGRAGADANTRGDARIGVDARGDTRGRRGADAEVRRDARIGIDGPANTRGRASIDADARGRGGRGTVERGDARIGIDGRADGRLDKRADGRIDGGGDSRYSANWANRSRVDLRGVRNNMASAFGGNQDRVDFDGRNRDYDGRDRDRDNDGRDRDRTNDGRGRDNDGRDRDWRDRNRADYWNRWGGNVRSSFRWGSSPYYTNQWWSGRNLIGLGLGNYAIGGVNSDWWGYQPWGNNYPSSYWWGRPRWNSFYTWFPNYGWNRPYYYDYGYGGNVVYRDNRVFVSGQYVGTVADYAASAADLAYIDPHTIEPTPADGWKPLGTFSVAISQDEQNPPRVMQLAVNQQGLISGTIYNRTSDKLYTVQGRVDKYTQRVAFTIGNDPNVVLETGLYNLTVDETPVLVHFNESRAATYLFVRLDEPAQQQAEGRLTPGVEALR